MANAYVWKVIQADRIIETGMIQELHYVVTATSEDALYTAQTRGVVTLRACEPDEMIAYEAVTEAQAITWVQTALGGEEAVAGVCAGLDKRLSEKRTPKVGAGTPWST